MSDRFSVDLAQLPRIASHLDEAGLDSLRMANQIRLIQSEVAAAGPLAQRASGQIASALGQVSSTAGHLQSLGTEVAARGRDLGLLEGLGAILGPDITFPGQDVVLPGPDINLPGIDVLPGPDIRLPGPDVLPGPDINVPGPDINLPGPDINIPGVPGIVLPGPDINVPGFPGLGGLPGPGQLPGFDSISRSTEGDEQPPEGGDEQPPEPGDTTVPGPYAGESIPARGPERDWTQEEQDNIDRIGKETGCHTCGTKDPGTKSGHFIPDHQQPSALNPDGEPQRLYPHCLNCSRRQGGQVRVRLLGS